MTPTQTPVETTSAETFLISRQFSAPVEKVWQAWTNRAALEKWWGPVGMELCVEHFDLRPGGMFLYSMTDNSGVMWGQFIYKDIQSPDSFSYVLAFSDPEGNITRAPFSDSWPLETYVVVKLNEAIGKTTMTLEATPINASAEERKTFLDGHESMKQGYGSTLDNLEQFLDKSGTA